MMTDGRTMVLGLMGDPVEHTLSPLIHNTFSETDGINAVYEAFHVKRGDTGNAVKGGFSLGIQGFNVTVPHKEDVIPYLSDIDPAAKKIGAVNTLVRTEKGYKGYNTDYLGIMRQIRECGFNIENDRVLLTTLISDDRIIGDERFLCSCHVNCSEYLEGITVI